MAKPYQATVALNPPGLQISTGRRSQAVVFQVRGSVPERPKGTGCKPVGLCLRRFKSFSAHNGDEARRLSAGPCQFSAPLPEHALHDDGIEPGAELAAHLSFRAHNLKPAGSVKRHTRFVTVDDVGHDGVKAPLDRHINELVH